MPNIGNKNTGSTEVTAIGIHLEFRKIGFLSLINKGTVLIYFYSTSRIQYAETTIITKPHATSFARFDLKK